MGQERSSPSTLEDRSLRAVANLIKERNARRVVVLTGAGISTSAGIPDFRSPGTGLYANLARLNLPYPEAVFDISFFRTSPEPFYVLARELYPGKFRPTISHAFISLLAKKDLLHKLFTQNIDCLERAAGVPPDRIIEAHGSFATQRCIECRDSFPDDAMLDHVERGEVPKCTACGGLVKPDIVFFGEGLPMEFSRNSHAMTEADLVLIIGTSLTVYPFAALPGLVRPKTPRVLFNREQVGEMGERADDVLELGACDVGIQKLAEELGWLEELNELWEEMVGPEEAKKQRAMQAVSGEELEELVEEELVEAITARVEGIELKGDEEVAAEDGAKESKEVEGTGSVVREEDPEACKAEDKEALKEEPTRAYGKSTTSDAGEGLKHHLEMHLHQKTGAIAEKYSGSSDGPEAQDTNASEKPAGARSEEKVLESKSGESHDEGSRGQEKL